MSGGGSGKTDMERIGLFQEMGYVSIGDRYVPPGSSKYKIHYMYLIYKGHPTNLLQQCMDR